MRKPERYRPIEILLVEDNPADVRLTKEGLKESKVLINLHVVGDGEEAITFLYRKGEYEDAPRPDLILLDLNLPKRNGKELLVEIKGHNDLKRIPVIILTASSHEDDVLDAYNNHANCYITKPGDLDSFFKVVNSIENFWLSIVSLPPEEVS